MIAQVIIAVIQELLNWRFAGALSVLLLGGLGARVPTSTTACSASRTLSGGDAGAASRRRPPGPARAARRGARRARSSPRSAGCRDRLARLWERLVPVRARPAASAGSRAASCGPSSLLIIGFLCLPSLLRHPGLVHRRQLHRVPAAGASRCAGIRPIFDSPAWVGATIRSFVVGARDRRSSPPCSAPARPSCWCASGCRARRRSSPCCSRRWCCRASSSRSALFYLYARLGLVGTIARPGHRATPILAAPYVVITVMAVLKTYDERLDQAAWSLGASKWRTLVHITLPQIRGGLSPASCSPSSPRSTS